MVIGLVSQEQIEALSAVLERLDAKGLHEESRTLREVVAQLKAKPQEVPASTAAEILRVTPQTVRNWVRSGTLPGRRDPTGHFYVRLDTLEPAIRLNQLMPDVPTGTYTDEEIDAAIEAVRARRRSRATIGA
jgi:hypothetical protein